MQMRKSLLFMLAILLIFNIKNLTAQDGLKVFISVDMEGIAGVVAGDQVSTDGLDYNMARIWTTQETNAAIRGAIDAGAKEIVVNDSHGFMRNIIAHELDPAADLISGSPKPLGMMQGIDDSFDAAIFIGYHARAGSINGVLDHTYSGATVYSLKINGVEMGESELNATIAGYFGVPVVLISGDKALSEQIKNSLDRNIVAVVVKEGIGRYAAKSIAPSAAQQKIRQGTITALENLKNIKPYNIAPPYKFEIEFLYSYQADAAELIPGVERLTPRSVEYSIDDFIEGFRLFRAILLAARQ